MCFSVYFLTNRHLRAHLHTVRGAVLWVFRVHNKPIYLGYIIKPIYSNVKCLIFKTNDQILLKNALLFANIVWRYLMRFRSNIRHLQKVVSWRILQTRTCLQYRAYCMLVKSLTKTFRTINPKWAYEGTLKIRSKVSRKMFSKLKLG